MRGPGLERPGRASWTGDSNGAESKEGEMLPRDCARSRRLTLEQGVQSGGRVFSCHAYVFNVEGSLFT